MAKVTKEEIAAKVAAMEALKQPEKKGWLTELINKKESKTNPKKEIPIRLEKAGYRNTFWG